MRAIIQRVTSATVRVDGQVVGRCKKGLLALVGAHVADTDLQAVKMADKVLGLRIFNDADGKMNLSLRDLQGLGEGVGVLAISNFTIYGDTVKNRRPSFVEAAPYEVGKRLFDRFVLALKQEGCPTETGVFGAQMDVKLVNDGPVTLILDVDAKS